MTKEFQQELKDKIKAGIKPSHLKRSKSADDIPPVPSSLSDPPIQLLQDQLKEKQKEIENLRKQLEETNQKLTETTQALDHSLQARYEAVKQFDQVYTKLQLVKQELDDNIDQASTELLSQDQTITKLRTQKQQAQVKIQALEKDLSLTQRLIKLKDPFLPNSETKEDYLKYIFSGLALIILGLWLTKTKKQANE